MMKTQMIALATGFALALAALPTSAATKTWTGLSGGLWSTAANWSPAGVPGTNDSLNFPVVAAGRIKTMTNDLAGRTFTDLTFTINGYILRGSPVTLTDGINAAQPNLGNTLEVALTLDGHQTITVGSTSGTLLLSGDVNLNRANLSIDGGGSLNVSGVISNRGGVVMVGSNTVTFFGTASNRFDGTMSVLNGTLILNKVSSGVGQIAVPGDLIVGTTKPAIVQLVENSQIAPDAAVTIHQAGVLDLNGQTNTVGSLLFHGGGTAQTGPGLLRLGGDVTAESAGVMAMITGSLYLGTGSRTFTVNETAGGVDLDIQAVVSGGDSGPPLYLGAGITKVGAGQLRLAGANSFTGRTFINDGQLQVSHPLALGADTALFSGTVVGSNGLLRLVSVQVGNEPLTLNHTAPSGYAMSCSATSVWAGPVTMSTDSRLWSDGTLVFSNALSGAGGLQLEGQTFELAGPNANTYAGTTWVDCALLRLNHSSQANDTIPGALIVGANSPVLSNFVQSARSQQIADTAKVTLYPRGVLDLNGRADWIDEIEFVGGSAFQCGRVQTAGGYLGVQSRIRADALAVGSFGGNLRLASATVFEVATNGNVNVPAMIQEGGFTLQGGGNLNLQGLNTFAGAVIVETGTLLADGDFALGTITAGTTVQPGGTLNLQPSVTSLNEPLTLSGSGMLGYGALEAHGNATLPNTVTLVGNAVVSVETNLLVILQGVLSGSGMWSKIGPGTLRLAGTAPNEYFGTTMVRDGLLELAKSIPPAITGSALVIGDDVGDPASAIVRELATSQIGDVLVTIGGDGLLDLNGQTDTIGASLTLKNGGRVQTGTGMLYLPDGNNLVVSHDGATLSGRLHLGTTISSITVASNASFTCAAEIRGTATITKAGAGSLYLTASNTFTGPLDVSEGRLWVQQPFSLGQTNGGTTVRDQGQLALNSNVTIRDELLTLQGSRPDGSVWVPSDTNVWDGPVVLAADAVVNVGDYAQLTLSGAISGPAGLTKVGPGRLVISGIVSNSYSGTTWIQEGFTEGRKTTPHGAIPGALVVGNPDTNQVTGARLDLFDLPQIQPLAPVVVHRWGAMILDRIEEQSIGSLAGSGSVRIDYHTNLSRLIFGGDNRSTVFSGSLWGNYSNAEFVKRGQGEFLIDGSVFLYYGNKRGVLVEAGTLRVNGYMSQGAVQVSPGATLSGDGRLSWVTVSGGTISPGASPGRTLGTLRCDHLLLESNAVVEVDIQGAGWSQYDQIEVTDFWEDGVLAITNASLRVFLNAAPAEGRALAILRADAYPEDPIQGQFNGLPDGAPLQVPPFAFRINYTSPDSVFDEREVTLTLVDPPLQSLPAQVLGNNAQPGRINALECDALYVPLSNAFPLPLTGIRAVLTAPAGDMLVTQPESRYPDIPPGGVATNITPFQLSTFDWTAGSADLELSFISSAPAFSSKVQIEGGMAGPLQRFDNTTNYTIPGRMTLEVPIDTRYFEGIIEAVEVSLHLTHQNVGDLDISLVAHDGQTVLLSRALGGTNDSYGLGCDDKHRTTFRDKARTPIVTAQPPFAGVFQPLQPLGAFFGKFHDYWDDDPWRLRIVNRGNTPGVLQCWSLYLSERVSTNGSGSCLTCLNPVLGTLTTNDPVQVGVLWSGDPSTCGQPGPGVVYWQCVERDTNGNCTATNTAHYDAHVFTNAGPATCMGVAVNTTSSSGSGVFAAAYLDTFHPGNPALNHLGDAGHVAHRYERSFSFTVPVGARFVVVVGATDTDKLPCDYTLKVTGGDCLPPALTIAPASPPNKVAVSWTTASGGYQLESAPVLTSTGFASVTNSPAVVAGQFVVTNTASGTNRFYRLHRP